MPGMRILLGAGWIGVAWGLLAACAEGGGGGLRAGREGRERPCSVTLSPGDDDQTLLQGALIEAESGDAICLSDGRYQLTGQLSLDVDDVTVRGEPDTVLDFTGQTSGANGLAVTSNAVTLEDLRIENTQGDGVRATNVSDLAVRRVRVEWTRGPSPDNGGYGIYPVSSTGILIEDSYASGAADTGIYVGQSSRIVIRNNEVTQNVAGIEIENSTDAEVYGNRVHDNTGGILLFNLPGLPVKDGKRARVYDNTIESNNHENFAESGNIVAMVPPGTGMFVLASDDNEVHDNTIAENQSSGIAVLSWYVAQRDEDGRMDPEYDWFPERNYVHGNTFVNNGAQPQASAALIAALAGETTLADMVWDGIVDSAKLEGSADEGLVPPESLRNCFLSNGDATFKVLDLENNGAGKSSDVEPYACERPALEPIML
jgi:parallel beta-helix repeat protein